MDCDLIDPMCGSGTLLIEAAMLAYGVAPGTYRKKFGFESWNDFDADLFDGISEESYDDNNFEHKIIGSDFSDEAIAISQENINQAFLAKKISVKKQDFFDIKPTTKGFIITNPPYGERLQPEDMKEFYKKVGDKLKLDFSGFTSWIIGSNVSAMKFVGLKPDKKIKLYNGPLECSFRKYTLYDGSRRYEPRNPKKG